MELLVVVLMVFALWALVRTYSIPDKLARRTDLEETNQRISQLENTVREQRKLIDSRPRVQAQEPEPVSHAPVTTAGHPERPTAATVPQSPVPPLVEKSIHLTSGVETDSAAPQVPVSVTPPGSQRKTEVPPPSAIPKPITVVPPPRPSVSFATLEQSQTPPPSKPSPSDSAAHGKSQPRAQNDWAEIEQRVGVSWLNKLGITAFVVGGAFLANYAMQEFGPVGRVTLLYVLSAGLLCAGAFGERQERFKIIGRALLGGGWALAYATTYALHNVKAVMLVESPGVGFTLLFIVAAAMVAHSLRYNSQLATGFAYGLAFASVAVSRLNLGTMVAMAILAASLVVILWRRSWYLLEPLAILATFGLHYMWVQQQFEWVGGHKPFPDATASTALLIVYWATFTVSQFLRDDREAEHRITLTLSFVLNAGGFLAVMAFQALYPNLRFWFLMGLGLTYFALAAFSRRMERRLGFLLCSTLGAALSVVAIPYRFLETPLELIWLAEAEALLFIGWKLAESHLRKLGWAASAILAGYIVIFDLALRTAFWSPPNLRFGILLAVLSLTYFFNSRAVERLLKSDADGFDRKCALLSAPVGTALLASGAWVAIPFLWVIVAWWAIDLLLHEYANRVEDTVLRVCGHGLAVAAIVRMFVVNFPSGTPGEPPAIRLVSLWTLTVAFGIAYLVSWRLVPRAAAKENPELLDEFFGPPGVAVAYAAVPAILSGFLVIQQYDLHRYQLTWAMLALSAIASLVSYPIAIAHVMTAAWLALPFMWVAVVWSVIAVLLGEAGRYFKRPVIILTGHAAALATFIRILFVNLQNAPVQWGISLRWITVGISTVMFYFAARRATQTTAESKALNSFDESFDPIGGIRAAYTWSGTIVLALLIWNEVTNAAIGLAWGIVALALVEVGRSLPDRPLVVQGYMLLVLSFARIFFADLNVTTVLGPLPARALTVSLLAGIYYFCAFTEEDERSRMRTALFWFGSTAAAALLRFEISSQWVAIGWALFGALLYVGGRRLDLRAFRDQAYLLTLMVGARCAFENMYRGAPEDFPSTRLVTVLCASFILFGLLAVTLQDRSRRGEGAPAESKLGITYQPPAWRRFEQVLDVHPQHLFFFTPVILVTALVYFEARLSLLTALWGLEAVIIFVAALFMSERSYRWFSLGLFGLCILRLVFADIWTFDQLGRIISFMGLGAALLLVSFLYAKYGESWKRYL